MKKCLYKRRKQSSICSEEQLSCCALYQNVLVDLVSTSCGHWFCTQCIRSYWDSCPPSGHSSSPQCRKRPTTGAGLVTPNQSSCAPGKTEHIQSELPSAVSAEPVLGLF
ncbi:hypothetical protein AMECASPLE_038102 [Ameca splendens]|uniref:RING-type domain-containing protein n=1 Tax=Ameca splendens TaxID=208324 RepID=A0ABV0ZUF6_9TELE